MKGTLVWMWYYTYEFFLIALIRFSVDVLVVCYLDYLHLMDSAIQFVFMSDLM